MTANIVEKFGRVPWSPVKAEPPKAASYGDLRRAEILRTQTLPDPGRMLTPSHEHALTEPWAARKLRRARERAGIVVEPPKRVRVGGRQIDVSPSTREAVREDWLLYTLPAVAAYHHLSVDQVQRICADLGKKPRSQYGLDDLIRARRPAAAKAARKAAHKRPVGRPLGSGSSRRANARLRRGEKRTNSAGSRVKGSRAAGRRYG
jgi:hypothetical protein